MAYVDQDKKKRIEALVKPIFKKYGIKARLGVRNHSELVCRITAGPIDFFADYTYRGDRTVKDYIQVNHYHYDRDYTGKALEFFKELIPALQSENWDKSDIQTDYFNVGYYLSVEVGQWDKPYVRTEE